MNWEVLAAGALGGGIVNVIWNYFSKRLDYDYDYKKYILKKRQEAYEDVQNVLSQLAYKWVFTANGEQKLIHLLFISSDNRSVSDKLNKLTSDLASLKTKSLWLSHKILNQLMFLDEHVFFLIMGQPPFKEHELANFEFVEKKYISFGISTYDVLEQKKIDLLATYVDDLKTLNKINSFTRKKFSL